MQIKRARIQNSWCLEDVEIPFTRHAVFEDCIETELKENWPAWQVRVDELVRAGTGFLDKNTATYRHAAMTTGEKAPDVSQEVLAAVRNLRGGT